MKLLDVHALLDDGQAEWDRVTALNTGRALATSVGASLALRIKVVRVNGVPVDISAMTVAFSMKQTTEQVESYPGIARDAVNSDDSATNGTATVTIEPEDTAQLVPGRYVYDVWLIEAGPGGSRTQIVATSAFVLTPTVTRS